MAPGEKAGNKPEELNATIIDGVELRVTDTESIKRLLEIKADKFQGGQIQYRGREWKDLTSDKTILEMINGTKVELSQSGASGKQATNSSYYTNKEEKRVINNELQELLRAGVITPSKHEGEFVSGIFTPQKIDGMYRMILNLKEFNKNVEYKKFEMETLKPALNPVTKNCWMASIDLVSAYYCVPIAREHRKYLNFLWQGQLYEYTCYSNGLAQCPRCFTKITKPIYAYLHT